MTVNDRETLSDSFSTRAKQQTFREHAPRPVINTPREIPMPKLYKNIQCIEAKNDPIKTEKIYSPRLEISWETLILYIQADCQSKMQSAQEQAFQTGLQQAENILEAPYKTLQTLLDTIPSALAQNRLALKEEIADIVCILIEQLFLQKPPEPALLEEQINTLLSELNNQQHIKIHLSPTDLTHLQQGDITLQMTTQQQIAIISDPTLLPGGCLIHSEHGLFDASLENRFQRFQEILRTIKKEYSHASLA